MKVSELLDYLGVDFCSVYQEDGRKASKDMEVKSFSVEEIDYCLYLFIFPDYGGDYKVPEDLEKAKREVKKLYEYCKDKSLKNIIADGYSLVDDFGEWVG